MSVPSRAARYQQAQQLYAEKRHAEALRILDELAQELPDHPDLLYARTLCLSAAGQKEEALRTCDRLIATHGHAKAQHLKARILAREPEPNLIELGPVKEPRAKYGQPSLRRAIPLILLVVLLGVGGGLYAYLQGTGGAAGNGAAAVTPGTQPPVKPPVSLREGVPVNVANETGAHLEVWVDQVTAQDAPALRVAPGAGESIALREGVRLIRVRATIDENTRFNTVAHPIEVEGPGTLRFGTEINDQGIREVTIDLQ